MTSESTLRWIASSQVVERSIRKNSRTFFFATALLPREQRQAIRALYAFCRATDDLVDEHKATHAQVEAWREKVRLPAEEQQDPVLYLWAQVRSQYRVNPRYEDELITGVAYDIFPERYATWEDLENYCYHVASTVGLLSIPIVGLREGISFECASPYAIKLGIALQLTNILRDVGEDARQGRVYLPESDLERFGLTRGDILSGVQNESFIELMKFEIARARQLYQESLPGIAMLSPSGQLAVGAAALLYRALLDEIEAIQYGVHQFRAYTTERKKLAMLPGILYTVLRLKPRNLSVPQLSYTKEC
jgi:phytoene synthase